MTPLGVPGWSRNAETGARPIRGGRAIDSTQYAVEYCVGRCARVDLSVCSGVSAGWSQLESLMVGDLERMFPGPG